MKHLLCCGVIVALVVYTGLHAEEKAVKEKPSSAGNIGHMVYFQLKESTPAERDKLVAACKKYLDGHEGTVYFSAGILAEDLNREVNVRDWDVALHLIFKDRAAHDKYQEHPRHLQFIEENKANWKQVRVFDAVVK